MKSTKLKIGFQMIVLTVLVSISAPSIAGRLNADSDGDHLSIVLDATRQKNRSACKTGKDRVRSIIGIAYRNTAYGVEHIIDELTSVKGFSYLAWLRTVDNVRNTSKADEHIRLILRENLVNPLFDDLRDVDNVMDGLTNQIGNNCIDMKKELASKNLQMEMSDCAISRLTGGEVVGKPYFQHAMEMDLLKRVLQVIDSVMQQNCSFLPLLLAKKIPVVMDNNAASVVGSAHTQMELACLACPLIEMNQARKELAREIEKALDIGLHGMCKEAEQSALDRIQSI